MPGYTLDAGALVAFERGDRAIVFRLAVARENGVRLTIPAGVLAQVWRDGQRQARLSHLLRSNQVDVEPLDEQRARQAGRLCGLRGTADVIDASLVLCARERRQQILTSDVDDLRHLDPTAVIVRV